MDELISQKHYTQQQLANIARLLLVEKIIFITSFSASGKQSVPKVATFC